MITNTIATFWNNKTIRLFLPGLLIFMSALSMRLYFSFSIGDSGDEFIKWYELKRVLYGLGWDRFDHHTVRWSLNTPTLIAQWLFGTRPAVYYITPAVFGALAALFLFNIVKSISGSAVAVLAAFLFSVTPAVSRAGSQFLPAIFTCTYVLGTAYYLLRYTQTKPKQTIYLVIAALFLFFAYGTKVPNLFFLPGIIIFLYWRTRSVTSPLLFLSILLVLFILETIGLALYSGDFILSGRLHYLGFHMDRMLGEQHVYHLSDIWKRWLMLPAYWQWLLVLSCFGGAFSWSQRYKNNRSGIILIFMMLLSFSLLTTFAIVDADPLRFVQPLRVRYLTVTIPLAIVVLCCSFAMLHFILVPGATMIFCGIWAYHNYSVQLKPDWVPAVLKVNEYQRMISAHWHGNYALCFKTEKHARLYRSVYLEDTILFKPNGSVEPYRRINPKRLSFPTGQPYIFSINRTNKVVGYLELTRKQAFKSKKDFTDVRRLSK